LQLVEPGTIEPHILEQRYQWAAFFEMGIFEIVSYELKQEQYSKKGL